MVIRNPTKFFAAVLSFDGTVSDCVKTKEQPGAEDRAAGFSNNGIICNATSRCHGVGKPFFSSGLHRTYSVDRYCQLTPKTRRSLGPYETNTKARGYGNPLDTLNSDFFC